MTYRVVYTNGYETMYYDVVDTRKLFRMISKTCKRVTKYEMYRFRFDLHFYFPVRVKHVYRVLEV